MKRNLEIIKNNLNLLDIFFDKYKRLFKWIRPKAGSIAFPRIINGKSEEFCSTLLDKKSVLLMPSSNYDYGDHHFRIGFGRKDMPQGLVKLEDFIIDS